MARSNKMTKLLRECNFRQGDVFDKEGRFIEAGTFKYVTDDKQNGFYVNKTQIPISSIRSVTPSFNQGRALVFVDPAYEIGRRVR